MTGGAWVARAGSTIVLNNAPVDTASATIIPDGPGSRIDRDYGGADALSSLAKIGSQGAFTIQNGRFFTTAGDLIAAGRVNVGAGSVLAVPEPSRLLLHRGVLAGTGLVDADVENDGGVSPGLSIGALTVDGDYAQLAGGRLVIEIGGTNPGQVDLLHVTGGATLGGMLELSAVNGFVVHPGDSFTVLTCASRQGSFETVFGKCLAPGVCFDVSYFADHVQLVARQLAAADVEEVMALPGELELVPVLGGPASASARLRVDLPVAADAQVDLFDVSGRHIARLLDGPLPAGSHMIEWQRNGGRGSESGSESRSGSGIYFARLVARTSDGTSARTARVWVVR